MQIETALNPLAFAGASRPRLRLPGSIALALGIEIALIGLTAYAINAHTQTAVPAEQIVELSLTEPQLTPKVPPPPKPLPQPKILPTPHVQPHVSTVVKPQPEPQAPSEVAEAPTPPAPPPTPSANERAKAAEFEAQLKAAIQNAMQYPAAARMANMAGRAKVALHLRDSTISDIHIVQSSGIGLLDQAALAAVRNAAVPIMPEGLRGKALDYQLWVIFELTRAR